MTRCWPNCDFSFAFAGCKIAWCWSEKKSLQRIPKEFLCFLQVFLPTKHCDFPPKLNKHQICWWTQSGDCFKEGHSRAVSSVELKFCHHCYLKAVTVSWGQGAGLTCFGHCGNIPSQSRFDSKTRRSTLCLLCPLWDDVCGRQTLACCKKGPWGACFGRKTYFLKRIVFLVGNGHRLDVCLHCWMFLFLERSSQLWNLFFSKQPKSEP